MHALTASIHDWPNSLNLPLGSRHYCKAHHQQKEQCLDNTCNVTPKADHCGSCTGSKWLHVLDPGYYSNTVRPHWTDDALQHSVEMPQQHCCAEGCLCLRQGIMWTAFP